jgi:antitoxin component of RelBE/YafQ-DinJ toxin-antitoxin module
MTLDKTTSLRVNEKNWEKAKKNAKRDGTTISKILQTTVDSVAETK